MNTQFVIDVIGQSLCITRQPPVLVAGTTGYTVRFQVPAQSVWEGMAKTAVFRCDGQQWEQLLDGDSSCAVPWESLIAGKLLYIGLYAIREDAFLPTIWSKALLVRGGASPAQPAQPPAQELTQQMLAAMGDLGDLDTEARDNLVAAINEVLACAESGGGSSGEPGTLSLGYGLEWDSGGALSVRAAEQVQEDNPLPVTSAAVYATLGSIETILQHI